MKQWYVVYWCPTNANGTLGVMRLAEDMAATPQQAAIVAREVLAVDHPRHRHFIHAVVLSSYHDYEQGHS